MLVITVLLLLSIAQDFPRHEFQISYLHGQINSGLPSRRPHHGASLSYVSNLSRFSGLKLEASSMVDHHTHSGFTYRHQPLWLLFGTQIKDNRSSSRLKPFLHLMGGAARFAASTNPSACAAALGLPSCPARFHSRRWSAVNMIGGGLDLKLSLRVDLRLLQIDYAPLARYGQTFHSVRFGFGATFH